MLTTKEVAERLGVTAQTIRNWDKTGKLKPTEVSEGGNRLYSDSDIEKFRLSLQNRPQLIIGYYKGDEADEALMKSILECENIPYELFKDDKLQLTLSDALKTVLKKVVRGECSKVILLSDTSVLRYYNDVITEVANMNGIPVVTYVKNKTYTAEESQRLVRQLLSFNVLNYSEEIGKWLSSLEEND